ncbi:MAG: hypothetical protein P8Y70_03635 [Candidatus Lokiarchaeota archaeon]
MYDSLKKYDGKVYSGMKIGNSHLWNYNNGKWYEVKESPERWNIQFNCVKTRSHQAPENSGAKVGTKYHWYILADQIATKMESNSYQTSMNGLKFKIGHKRPHWKTFSYNYPEQDSYKQKIIKILEETLLRLKNE